MPPNGVSVSCILLTVPVVKDVVVVVNIADWAIPNRTSLPSMLPMDCASPTSASAGLPWLSAQKQTPSPIRNRIPIAAKMLRPSRPKILAVRLSRPSIWGIAAAASSATTAAARSRLRSRTILPKVITQAPGRSIMEYSSIKLEMMVGFSIGVAEFAPKNPPPFVPRCLIISSAATGPIAITCFVPSMVSTTTFPEKFCGTPFALRIFFLTSRSIFDRLVSKQVY